MPAATEEKAALGAWKTLAMSKGLLEAPQPLGIAARGKVPAHLTGVSLAWLEAFNNSLNEAGKSVAGSDEFRSHGTFCSHVRRYCWTTALWDLLLSAISLC